jgi:hypothetical protein
MLVLRVTKRKPPKESETWLKQLDRLRFPLVKLPLTNEENSQNQENSVSLVKKIWLGGFSIFLSETGIKISLVLAVASIHLSD